MAAKTEWEMWIPCSLDYKQIPLPTLWGGIREDPMGKKGFHPHLVEMSTHPTHGVSGDHARSLTSTHIQWKLGSPSPPLSWKGRHPSPLWAGATRSQAKQWNFHDHPMRSPPPLHSIRAGHKEGRQEVPSHSYLGGVGGDLVGSEILLPPSSSNRAPLPFHPHACPIPHVSRAWVGNLDFYPHLAVMNTPSPWDGVNGGHIWNSKEVCSLSQPG